MNETKEIKRAVWLTILVAVILGSCGILIFTPYNKLDGSYIKTGEITIKEKIGEKIKMIDGTPTRVPKYNKYKITVFNDTRWTIVEGNLQIGQKIKIFDMGWYQDVYLLEDGVWDRHVFYSIHHVSNMQRLWLTVFKRTES